jgi:hypothetical protein
LALKGAQENKAWPGMQAITITITTLAGFNKAKQPKAHANHPAKGVALPLIRSHRQKAKSQKQQMKSQALVVQPLYGRCTQAS